MRHLSKIFVVAVTVVFLTLSSAMAGNKFPNKDTAKNRQDNAFGTAPRDDEEPVTTFEIDENGNKVIKSKRPKKKDEEVNWYDKMPIIVEPQLNID